MIEAPGGILGILWGPSDHFTASRLGPWKPRVYRWIWWHLFSNPRTENTMDILENSQTESPHIFFEAETPIVRLCLPSPKMDQDRQTDSQPDRQTHESWVCCQSLWWWNRWKQIKIRPLLELSSVIFSPADLYHLTIPLFCFTWGLDLTLAQAWNCSDVAIQWVYCCPNPFWRCLGRPFAPAASPAQRTCRARLPVGFWWSMAPWMTLSSDPFWRSWGFWRMTERQEW